jgi:hypothetical protein
MNRKEGCCRRIAKNLPDLGIYKKASPAEIDQVIEEWKSTLITTAAPIFAIAISIIIVLYAFYIFKDLFPTVSLIPSGPPYYFLNSFPGPHVLVIALALYIGYLFRSSRVFFISVYFLFYFVTYALVIKSYNTCDVIAINTGGGGTNSK